MPSRSTLRIARPEDASRGAEALAHLLAVLGNAAEALDWIGADVDAKIVRAHRAQLERGQEWPGDDITPCEEYLPVTGADRSGGVDSVATTKSAPRRANDRGHGSSERT